MFDTAPADARAVVELETAIETMAAGTKTTAKAQEPDGSSNSRRTVRRI
jgi:hypothetical protein